MPQQQWNVYDADREDIIRLSRELHIFPLTARLLLRRGFISTQAARAFLEKSEEQFHDPFLLPDMEKAVTRLIAAVNRREHITVYGDYDADGVSATAVLYTYLRNLSAQVDTYIPQRLTEGYGVSNEAIDTLHARGTQLIVTVDTGVTAVEPAAYARSYGIDMIVTDHHTCRDVLPDCCAVIDPMRSDNAYPFPHLAGVGVAFKLICACELRHTVGSDEKQRVMKALCTEYLAPVSIGTVADIMPLVDENRLIVSLGLPLLSRGEHLGLSALLEASGRGGKNGRMPQVTSSDIAFALAPRINAAGRLGEAQTALSLFLSQTKQEAQTDAQQLCALNEKRRHIEDVVIEQARALVQQTCDVAHDPILVLAAEGWHTGVIGIAAGKLATEYCRPCVLISLQDGVGTGSGRSVEGVDLVAALEACAPFLEKFGGHEMAVGLTVREEYLPQLRETLCGEVLHQLGDQMPAPTILCDAQLSLEDWSLPMAEELSLLEPYGEGNPTPLFLSRDMIVHEKTGMGGDKHTRFLLCKGNKRMTAIYFGVSPDKLPFFIGSRVDVVYQANINEFMGRRHLQFLIQDMDDCLEECDKRAHSEALYRAMCAGETLQAQDAELSPVLPKRNDFTTLYRLLRTLCEQRGETVCTAQQLCAASGVALHRVLLALDVLEQTNLIKRQLSSNEQMHISLLPTEEKVDLEQSPLLQTLRAQYGTFDMQMPDDVR